MHPILSAVTSLLMSGPPPKTVEDVTIGYNGDKFECSISDKQLASIRRRAFQTIKNAGDVAYGEFPIDRNRLAKLTVKKMFTKEGICNALRFTPAASSASEYADQREHFKSSRLTSEDARDQFGVSAMGVSITAKDCSSTCSENEPCPSTYNWKESPVYNDINSCEDFTKALGAKSIPTVMYTVPTLGRTALAYFNDHKNATLLKRYRNGGPIVCSKSESESTIYHKMDAVVMGLDMIIHGTNGKDFLAWTLLKSCTAPDGKVYKGNNFKLDFGIYTATDIVVKRDENLKNHSIIVSQVAATANVAYDPTNLKYKHERYFGSIYAMKLGLEEYLLKISAGTSQK